MSDKGLFRSEALENHKSRWLGSVRVAAPISHAVGLIVSVAAGIAIVAWLWFGHYTRREHVLGSLVPQDGLIELPVRSSGTIEKIFVAEESVVRSGDPVVLLSGERSSEVLGDTSAFVINALHSQEGQLQKNLKNEEEINREKYEGMKNQSAMLLSQIHQLDDQLEIEGQKVSRLNDFLVRIRPLLSKGFISALQVQQQESEVLDAESQIKTLNRQRYDLAIQLENSKQQLRQLPLDAETKLNDLRRQIAQGRQELATNEADRSTVLRAPHAGTVSSLLVKPGQSVIAGQSLLALIPSGTVLQAQLLVPSKAVGFIKPGSDVMLHYAAFPYQKFGVQKGRIVSISHSALTSVEVTNLIGQQAPTSESMYRVLVSIKDQKIFAYGKQESLKPGMALDADMLLDRRRLIEWIFEPMYGMRRHMDASK